MPTEMTVMSKLEASESSWDFSALHDAELDVICPLEDSADVLWCASSASCGATGVWVQLELSAEF